MPRYAEMSKAELEAELAEVRARYGEMAARGLKLNMARGKPSAAQLELSLPLLDVLPPRTAPTAATTACSTASPRRNGSWQRFWTMSQRTSSCSAMRA